MNANDLISRAEALDAIDRERKLLIERGQYGAEHIVVHHARRQIEELPAVDAVPVVHGRWIEHEDCNGDSYYTCSACNCDWTTIDGTPEWNNMRYCPECGAKMDKED